MMNNNLIRNLFVILLCMGLFVTVFGIAGAQATGSAFSDVFVQELNLPREPEVYGKVSELYAATNQRSHWLLVLLGLAISISAGIGWWETRRRP